VPSDPGGWFAFITLLILVALAAAFHVAGFWRDRLERTAHESHRDPAGSVSFTVRGVDNTAGPFALVARSVDRLQPSKAAGVRRDGRPGDGQEPAGEEPRRGEVAPYQPTHALTHKDERPTADTADRSGTPRGTK
jgi:hypothetical protein